MKVRVRVRVGTGLQSGQAIVREGAERPVIKVYIYVYTHIFRDKKNFRQRLGRGSPNTCAKFQGLSPTTE